MKESIIVDEPSIDTQDRVINTNAFIVYRPEINSVKEAVFQNREAFQILSYSADSSQTGKTGPDVSSLCAKWKRSLEKKIKTHVETRVDFADEKDSGLYFLEVIRSGRRKYMVKGMALLGKRGPADEQEINYMFLLERICPEKINMALIARNWSLSQREQDIVRLLLADRGNKEISYLLGLSINTVKTYMKLLMRKLGVSSRAGIVSCLLTRQRAARATANTSK